MVGSIVIHNTISFQHYSRGKGVPVRTEGSRLKCSATPRCPVPGSVCGPNLKQHAILEAPALTTANPKETKQIRKAPTFPLLDCISGGGSMRDGLRAHPQLTSTILDCGGERGEVRRN
jgi:hypothetical protein